MKKVLLYVEKNQFVPFDYTTSGDQALKLFGFNSGNSVFEYALQAMLWNCNDVTLNTDLFQPVSHSDSYFDNINKSYDCVAYSPANIISIYNNRAYYEFLLNIYSKINIPIISIGLGAQSDYEYSLDFLDENKDLLYQIFKHQLQKRGGYRTARAFHSRMFKKDWIS